MNDMTIGMENLPNVFIDKIAVERTTGNAKNYRIQVKLKMFDYADDHSWRNKVTGLKVKCAFIEGEESVGLNNGNLSLYDMNVDGTNRVLVESCDEFRFDDRRDGYVSYTKIFEFRAIAPPIDLNVYAACFIDDLGFGISLFDKFYGPMAGDKIFVGGVVNEQSGYFFNPETNEEYGGPVHLHNSGYMEGSFHSDEPHAGLRYVQEENYKMNIASNMDNDVFIGGVETLGVTTQTLSEQLPDPSPTAPDMGRAALPVASGTTITQASTDGGY